MEPGYWIRIVIALLASILVGICFVNVMWVRSAGVRSLRVMGLGLISISIAWGTHARRGEPLKPWLIFTVLGLILCIWGMSKAAPGEKSQVKVNRPKHQ